MKEFIGKEKIVEGRIRELYTHYRDYSGPDEAGAMVLAHVMMAEDATEATLEELKAKAREDLDSQLKVAEARGKELTEYKERAHKAERRCKELEEVQAEHDSATKSLQSKLNDSVKVRKEHQEKVEKLERELESSPAKIKELESRVKALQKELEESKTPPTPESGGGKAKPKA